MGLAHDGRFADSISPYRSPDSGFRAADRIGDVDSEDIT
jgi:hypothetical protein